MKRWFVFLPIILIFLIVSCGPSAEEIATQTSTAATAIAISRTKTPTPTLTQTPTVTPTTTQTATMTPTPLGGGSGQIACLNCINGIFPSISLVNPNGTVTTLLTDKYSEGASFDWSRNGTELGYFSIIGTEEQRKPVTCVIDAYGYNEQCFEIGGGTFALSPDGMELAVESQGSLYLVNVQSGERQVLTEQDFKLDGVDWSPDGTKLVVAANEITVIDLKSGEKYVLVEGGETDYFNSPRWSPDGKKIVYLNRSNIFVVNTDGSNDTLLVKDASNPIWSPDGTQIAYMTGYIGQPNKIIVMNADGTNKVRLTPSQSLYQMSWAPDGKFIVYRVIVSGSLYGIFYLDLYKVEVATQTVSSLTQSHNALRYAISPDGSAIAFTLEAKGEEKCNKSFVMNMDGTILSEWKDISCSGTVGPWRPASGTNENSTLSIPTKGQSWEFESNGDTEGWKAFLDLTPIQVSNGNLLTSSTGNNPWMRSPIFALDAKTFSRIEVRMKSDSDSPIWLGFITSTDYNFDGPKTTGFDAIGDGQFHDYVLDMSNMQTWTEIVRQIQLKLVKPQTAVEIDYIHIK